MTMLSLADFPSAGLPAGRQASRRLSVSNLLLVLNLSLNYVAAVPPNGTASRCF
jgi:hypothetical protein